MAGRGPIWWLVGLGGVAAFAGFRLWAPSGADLEICVFRALLDLPCPGCGLTRSMGALARGSLTRAIDFHPLGPVFALEAGLAWAAWGWFGGERLVAAVSCRAELWAGANVVPLLALWLGRAATGTLPF